MSHLDQTLQALTGLPRPALNRLVGHLIEYLDEMDGDPDLEDDDPQYCEAGDDGLHPIYKMGVAYFSGEVASRPTKSGDYAEDQRYIMHRPAKNVEPVTQKISD